jgi:hypothetical protein
MMTARAVLRYLRAEPFRPIRIHMASGRAFGLLLIESISFLDTAVGQAN